MNTVVELDEVYIFPVSFAQQRLWLLDQLQPNNPAYNIPAAIRVQGCLNLGTLARCLNEIVKRHEGLRTTFATQAGEPVQVINPTLTLALPLVDLSGLTEALREDEVRRWAREEILQPFDLRQGPLLRTTVLRLAPEVHVVLFTMHHIISDGWSITVLLRELVALYVAYTANKPSPLPELAIQYADFAQWQRDWLQGEVLEAQLDYWKRQLTGMPVSLALPTDYPRPPVFVSKGSTHTFALPGVLKESLADLSRRQGATLFMTLLAAFQILLQRYSGQEDIVVGSPVANRTRAELEPLIGFFVNTLVLRTRLDDELTFLDVVARVREATLGAYAHQDLPFEQLVAALRPERDLSRSPLFQVMFVFHNIPPATINVSGLTFEPIELGHETTQFDLTAVITETSPGLEVSFEYSSVLFDLETIQRLAGNFQVLLEAVTAYPARSLSQLPLLTLAERHRLLVEWNQTASLPLTDHCLPALFEAQVERTPEAVALISEGGIGPLSQHLTYRELNRRANGLAHYLKKLGIGPERRLGVCLERSSEMVIALLSVLKSGAAYVPLDPGLPIERVATILSDAGVALLLTQERLQARLAPLGIQTIRVDTDGSVTENLEHNLEIEVDSAHLAYLIYTSGSTGQPKGVMIPHFALTNYVQAAVAEYGICSDDRVLQFASISFDASVEEIYPCLVSGGALILRSDSMVGAASTFLMHSFLWALTVLDLPTAYWHELTSHLEAGPAALPSSVRLVIIGGERALPKKFVAWRKSVGDQVQLINSYGPTETTVVATLAELSGGTLIPEGERELPIGRPLPNVQTYILDRHFQPMPIGVPGELCLGGVGLARGYWARPDLTAEKFIPNPFVKMEDGGRRTDDGGETTATVHRLPSSVGFRPSSSLRLYRTGDLARYRSDGKLEFLGRVDHQVKIRGFRIEPGEIEAALEAHPTVRESVVLTQEMESEFGAGKYLVAYVVAEAAADLTVSELRRFLQQRLPDYMLPSAFVFLEKLPLNPNGKVDRRALPSPDGARPNLQQAYVAPRNALEHGLAQVWQAVLKVERVGLYDNFFELGGDSLKAAVVINRLQHRLDRVIYLAPLFQAPTIADLAAYLTEHFPEVTSKLGMIEARDHLSAVVGLQAGGSRPPFFCVHPISGEALPYHTLARYLDSDQPAYAFQAPGLYGEAQPLARLEDLAALYVESLRQLQPEGPYQLGGWSMGGLVAFEMAQQLAAQDQCVSSLAIIDTCLEIFQDHSQDDLTTLVNYWTEAGEEIPGIGNEDLDSPEFEARMELLLAEARRLGRLNSKITPAQARQHVRVYRANIQAARAYVPKPYGGSMTFFRSQTQFVVQNQGLVEPTQRWRELAAGGVEVQLIPCEHFQMLDEPFVQTLARQLQSCLEKTRIENRFGPSYG